MINDYMVLMNFAMYKLFTRVCDSEDETYKGKTLFFHSYNFTVEKPVDDKDILLDKIVDQSVEYFHIIQGDVIFIKSVNYVERNDDYEVNIVFATNDRM